MMMMILVEVYLVPRYYLLIQGRTRIDCVVVAVAVTASCLCSWKARSVSTAMLLLLSWLWLLYNKSFRMFCGRVLAVLPLPSNNDGTPPEVLIIDRTSPDENDFPFMMTE
jgi:hypothetical protein